MALEAASDPVFARRETRGAGGDGGGVRVDVALTDSRLDLQGLRPGFAASLNVVERAAGVRFARLNQVHGDGVLVVDQPSGAPDAQVCDGDAMVTTTPGLGLMVRVADCVPVVLADPRAGVLGVVHAGRGGMALGVVTRAVEVMREQGAGEGRAVTAWLGPHVCGGCYEVPADLRDEVCAAVPEAWAETRWGTPSIDVGAGVRAQLRRSGIEVVDLGGCTLEDDSWHSYRRDGARSGRFAALAWMS